MFNRNTLAAADLTSPAAASGWSKAFGDLKVRPKLIVLHNVFFLILTCAVYFTLIPPFEQHVAQAKTIEIALVKELFQLDRLLPLRQTLSYDYREGSEQQLEVPRHVKNWLEAHPGEVWNQPFSDYLFRMDAGSGLYRRITLPVTVYDNVVKTAKLSLFAVLGIIYVLAVLALERIIMPLYVYRPLRVLLDADSATQRGDRGNELVQDPQIPGDEIGQIMRSRNLTVAELRRHEDELAAALAQLEETAEDLKKKNEMLETAKQSLESQDRLASLGLVSASVAHEMNTPLAVLQGSIEKLIETVPDSPSQERLQRMLRVAQRLRKISEGLVDFARVRRQEMDRVALKPLLDEAWSLASFDERAAAVKFASTVPDDLAVLGNPDRLIQVFVNLFRNSVYAIDSTGKVLVSARRLVREGRPMLAIAVEDNGRGIPAGVLPGIFDAFVSSRLDSNGTGLGLTVAAGIVEQHGGAISAANRPGGGACLEVTLRSAE